MLTRVFGKRNPQSATAFLILIIFSGFFTGCGPQISKVPGIPDQIIPWGTGGYLMVRNGLITNPEGTRAGPPGPMASLAPKYGGLLLGAVSGLSYWMEPNGMFELGIDVVDAARSPQGLWVLYKDRLEGPAGRRFTFKNGSGLIWFDDLILLAKGAQWEAFRAESGLIPVPFPPTAGEVKNAGEKALWNIRGGDIYFLKVNGNGWVLREKSGLKPEGWLVAPQGQSLLLWDKERMIVVPQETGEPLASGPRIPGAALNTGGSSLVFLKDDIPSILDLKTFETKPLGDYP